MHAHSAPQLACLQALRKVVQGTWRPRVPLLLGRTILPGRREMATKYNIKYFYDITDRSNFKANPDYKGVCHVALAQVGSGTLP